MTYMKSGQPFLYDDVTGEIVGFRNADTGRETYIARSSTDASGNTVLVGADGEIIPYINADEVGKPILCIGGDHPYEQYYGSNGNNGLAAMYNASGIKPYVAINTTPGGGTTPDGANQCTWDQLRTISERIETVSHGHRHYDNNEAPTCGITVTYTGPAATATFQVAGGNAVGVTAGGVEDFSFSLTHADYDTIAELVAAINALPNWTCTYSGELLGTEPSSNALIGVATSAKTALNWAFGGAFTVKYTGTVYHNTCLTNDGTNFRLFGDGLLLLTTALSGNLTAIVAAINAITGFVAALAGGATNPAYINGTELGTSCHKWSGPLWLSPIESAVEAGLSSSYLRLRNQQTAIETSAAQGFTIDVHAQSGGKYFDKSARFDQFKLIRGNALDGFTIEQNKVNGFIPHVSINTDYPTTPKVTALIEALADSPGHLLTMLIHDIEPDGSSGYSLPTTSVSGFSMTETGLKTLLSLIKSKVDSGAILVKQMRDVHAACQSNPTRNMFFNPKFKNSGDSLFNTTNTQRLPDWSIATTSQMSDASVTDGVFTFVMSGGTEVLPLYQAKALPPGIYELAFDVEVTGYTSGVGVFPFFGRTYGPAILGAISGATNIKGPPVIGNGVAKMTFSIDDAGWQPPKVISQQAGPFNLSTNKNIWLGIDGQGTIDNLDCSAGAVNPAAVTVPEVANAINAAIVAKPYPVEYHKAAKVVGGKLIIESPNISQYYANYIEIRAATTTSGTATIFGSSGNHYAYGKHAAGQWTDKKINCGIGIALANGATVKVSRPSLRRLSVPNI